MFKIASEFGEKKFQSTDKRPSSQAVGMDRVSSQNVLLYLKNALMYMCM